MQNFDKYFKQLPIIPEVASKILSIGDDNPDFSFKNLEDIISIDPMLTSRILKVANSALYSRQKEITTLQMAIGLLGFKNIKSLVLLLTASQFSKQLKNDSFYDDFWRHSIVTAFIAREIYGRIKNRSNQDTAFILGLLHDIGHVALHNTGPEDHNRLLASAEAKLIPVLSVEKRAFNADHREIGAAVLRHWNLPAIFSETASRHGDLNLESANKSLIYNISIADKIAGKLGFGKLEHDDYTNFDEIVRESDINQEDVVFFLNDYITILEDDPLFKECEELFIAGLKK